MQVLGVQLDGPFLHAALIQKTRKELTIKSLKSTTLEDPEHVKQLYTQKFKGKIATGISAKNLFIRVLELKIGKNRHAEQAAVFQSDATTHFNPAEILTVPLLEKIEGDGVEALLYTLHKDSLQEYLKQLGTVGIDPDAVSSLPSALCHFIKWKIPAATDLFVIHLGFDEWTCICMQKGRLKKSFAISGGVQALMTALWKDRKKILLENEIEGIAKETDLLQANLRLNPNLSTRLNELRQELSKILSSFQRSAGQKPVIFTGRADAFIHFPEFLVANCTDTVCEDQTLRLTSDERKYALSIGLALDHNKEYPYISLAPKVAEVFDWLTAHPVLKASKSEGAPLILQDFHYHLVKFPKIGTKTEPYQAKVEIEFQLKSPLHARKFHEALLKGDEKVDPHLEITWEALSDGYRTTFFLKNRNTYVP